MEESKSDKVIDGFAEELKKITKGVSTEYKKVETKLDEEAILRWLGTGAIPTDIARDLLSDAGIMKKFADSKAKVAKKETKKETKEEKPAKKTTTKKATTKKTTSKKEK